MRIITVRRISPVFFFGLFFSRILFALLGLSLLGIFILNLGTIISLPCIGIAKTDEHTLLFRRRDLVTENGYYQ